LLLSPILYLWRLFVNSKKTGAALQTMLQSDYGKEMVEFHSADLTKSERERLENAFKEKGGKPRILVSTTTLAWGCLAKDTMISMADGTEKPIVMGSYGIGSGRLLASIAEEHNDDWGLIWPITVAPYHVHLVMLPHKNDAGTIAEAANQLYEKLQAAGLEVLFDDRAESPGVKFNDADLIGLPIRVTVSFRGLKDGVIEIKRRDQDNSKKRMIPLLDAVTMIKIEKAALEANINSKVAQVPYEV